MRQTSMVSNQGLTVYVRTRSPFPSPDIFAKHKENVLTIEVSLPLLVLDTANSFLFNLKCTYFSLGHQALHCLSELFQSPSAAQHQANKSLFGQVTGICDKNKQLKARAHSSP